jgi:putative NADPH-quinone reductase
MSAKKKIFILLGHPLTQSFAGSFADEYERGAKEAGHEVQRVNISDLTFDPILHQGYTTIQELEPDLITLQEHFRWAEHIVILYPNWWCTMPAILKGVFDRMFLPGFAFRFRKDKFGKRTSKMDPLLTGRSARIIVTTGTRPFIIKLLYGDFTNELARGILGFSGINPVRISTIGPCEGTSESKRARWRKNVYILGKKAK